MSSLGSLQLRGFALLNKLSNFVTLKCRYKAAGKAQEVSEKNLEA
jgi:hypothetical protein